MKRILAFAFLALLAVSAFAIQGAEATSTPVVAATAVTASAATTSFKVNLPSSGAAVGDLYIACLGMNGAPTTTWPSGWSALFTPTSINGGIQLECNFKIAAVTDGATITVTLSSSVASVAAAYRITGALVTVNPGGSNPPSAANTANPDPPSVSIRSDNNLFIEVYTWTGSATNSAYSSGYTGSQLLKAQTTAATIAMATKAASAGSDDPGTATLSASNFGVAATLGVNPSADLIPAVVPTDFTIDYLFLALYVILITVGFLIPFVHLLAGLEGIVLAAALFGDTGNAALAGFFAAVSLFFLLAGFREA